MGRVFRLLACTALLAASACAADRVTAPAAPAPKPHPVAHKAKQDEGKNQRIDLVLQSKAIAPDAVWVVDGVIMMRQDALRLVDTDDILSVHVFKDAAHPVYGEPADAVVIITRQGRRP